MDAQTLTVLVLGVGPTLQGNFDPETYLTTRTHLMEIGREIIIVPSF